MPYHKNNLKEQLADIAFQSCEERSWQNVNMRLIAKKANVSTTACYRHYDSKDALLAEVMRKGFQLFYQDMKDVPMNKDGLLTYGSHYIKFGLSHPHIYDLMFGYPNIDMNLYPDLKQSSDISFQGLVEGVRSIMTNNSENEIMIKSYQLWASVHGLVGILRHSKSVGNETPTLQWIQNNLTEYLELTTFKQVTDYGERGLS